MVLTDELAISALDLCWRGVRSHTQRDIGIGKSILRGLARPASRSATGCRAQQRFQLRNVLFTQSESACYTDEHRVFCRMKAPISSDGHALQLQKQLNEWRAPATDRRKSIHRSIEIKLWLFSFAEGSPGLAPLFVIKTQHAEDLLNRVDLIARNDAINFAERTHYSKDGFDQPCLRNAQAADDESSQGVVGDVADKPADKNPGKAACEQPDECTNEG